MIRLGLLAACAALVLGPGSAGAHHFFTVEHDVNAPVIVTGKVVRVAWVNPHTVLHLESAEPGHSPQAWTVEAGAPNTLRLNGLNERSLHPGAVITVRGFRARDRTCAPACRMAGRDLIFADGSRLELLHATDQSRAAGKAYNDKREKLDRSGAR
jgi:hypothetical protein